MPSPLKSRLSPRLPFWDYRRAAAYFITIATQDRLHYFGAVKNGKMQLSRIGILADVFWHEIKNHAQNVELGAFVVMPNHVHGILILNNDEDDAPNCRDVACNVPTETSPQNVIPLQKNEQMAKISPQANSVSAIIRSYKSAVTRHARRLGLNFAWQGRFYDHIIRSETAYERITSYILNNPAKWEEDRFFKSL